MIGSYILEISYILASVFFIVGLKMLSHPEKARRGNIVAAIGMTMAILFTILFHKRDGHPIGNVLLILLAILIGTLIGWMVARKVKMTAMPQLVSLFNGMGGACAALISMMEFPHVAHEGMYAEMASGEVLSILAGLVIGSVSFAGSMIAFGKLNGNIGDLRIKWLRYVNVAMLAVIVAFVAFIMSMGSIPPAEAIGYVYALLGLSLIYGVLFVMPIGGADMPVVISLLNSFTGIAAATGGFLYSNQAMLTGGILVGSAGTILTILMCKAMNR
ncbi:MAG TPA: NAD(P)(+) transhydrogenase (Re/Si-specific) subunit beta, partial [Bacteroidales bacterium]|nr:NAD(P)(+) transhydrogenase (Re/Si-specific) subunit beta [Bacteroidales bacterium]